MSLLFVLFFLLVFFFFFNILFHFVIDDHCSEKKNVEYLLIIERKLVKKFQLHLLQVILNHSYSEHIQSHDSGRDVHVIIIIFCTP